MQDLGALKADVLRCRSMMMMMMWPCFLILGGLGLGLGVHFHFDFDFGVEFRFCGGRGRVLVLPFGTSAPVLKPVVDIGLRDVAVLAELGGNLFDLLLGRSSVALVEYALQNLQLHRSRSPPLPRCDLVAAGRQQRIAVQISQSDPP